MSIKKIKSDKILLEDRVLNGYIYFENGKILAVSTEDRPADECYDFTGLYVAPGFVDIHTHGGGGNRFEGSVEEIVAGCNFHLKHGTTTICPTVSAAPFAEMAASIARIAEAMRDSRVLGTIAGAHAEGPYLSAAQAGAQAPDFIHAPDENEYLPLLKAHAADICRFTYAPENDEGERFAKALQSYGIVASAGHTNAILSDMQRAMENGCHLITHLYSCTSTVTRDHGFRRAGVIEAAFLEDDLFVEIICDGKHLPPSLIQLVYKIKGPSRIALITDSLALTGTDQKTGRMQATDFVIEDGVCKLLDRTAFAGSIATADRLVRVAVKEAGIPLLHAVQMMTATPADIMHLAQKGRIMAGRDSDFTVFDEDITVKHVFANGNAVAL